MAQPNNSRVAASSGITSASGARISGRSPNVAQAVLLASTIAQLVITLLITIYLARELSAAAFGFFSLVGTTLILARNFLDMGMSNIAAREITRDRARERPL